MTARRIRWFLAILSVTVELISFMAWHRWLARQSAAAHVPEAPAA